MFEAFRELFTGENEPQTVAEYRSQICADWHNTTSSILAVARLCARAKLRLSGGDKRTLIAELPFGGSAFSKLAAVGADPRLYDPAIVTLLPPHYSTLYEVSRWDNEKFHAAVAAKTINRRAKRGDLIQRRKGRAGTQRTGLALMQPEEPAVATSHAVMVPGGAVPVVPAPEHGPLDADTAREVVAQAAFRRGYLRGICEVVAVIPDFALRQSFQHRYADELREANSAP
jgi:hypothetical protein